MDDLSAASSEKEERFKQLLLVSAILINLLVSIYLFLLIFPPGEESRGAVKVQENKGDVITVEVLNGSGIPNASAMIADYLRGPGIDILQTGNYETFDIDETMVIDLSGNYHKAKIISSKLGLDSLRIVTITNPSRLLDISIIAGKDFKQLKLEN
ncbi:MAG: LytR C-terminal domain-containing protein [Ignavibacteriaceae bacterium]|nr:LytR C-terminal domain-containing protein [Ignavibacteriaceae bacterium]